MFSMLKNVKIVTDHNKKIQTYKQEDTNFQQQIVKTSLMNSTRTERGEFYQQKLIAERVQQNLEIEVVRLREITIENVRLSGLREIADREKENLRIENDRRATEEYNLTQENIRQQLEILRIERDNNDQLQLVEQNLRLEHEELIHRNEELRIETERNEVLRLELEQRYNALLVRIPEINQVDIDNEWINVIGDHD